MTDTPALRDQLHALLAEARALDDQATQARARAGQLLISAGYADGQRVCGAPARLGVDSRHVQLLVAMAMAQRAAVVAARARQRRPAGVPDRAGRGW